MFLPSLRQLKLALRKCWQASRAEDPNLAWPKLLLHQSIFRRAKAQEAWSTQELEPHWANRASVKRQPLPLSEDWWSLTPKLTTKVSTSRLLEKFWTTPTHSTTMAWMKRQRLWIIVWESSSTRSSTEWLRSKMSNSTPLSERTLKEQKTLPKLYLTWRKSKESMRRKEEN